ncbi:SCO family protein [Marinimicrobium sp. C2-29]|uniref:SCO family protein n=1 Tax=Marinimicrobium sp. C2-29 TaxID=3139825 RepID=UPI003138AF66
MRIWLLCASVLVLLLSGTAGYLIIDQYAPPPQLQGAYLQPARKVESFQLVDHHQKAFTRDHLKGQWHLVTYGYTHCPDICPMTLARLAGLVERLEREQVYPDLQVLFYSVDGERDTPEVLAQYTPHFNEDFIGLTRSGSGRRGHRAFEQSLGILADVQSEEGWVNHGVMLMLLNPEAQLQAIFKPERNKHGLHHFTEEQLFRDYRAVRDYYSQRH